MILNNLTKSLRVDENGLRTVSALTMATSSPDAINEKALNNMFRAL